MATWVIEFLVATHVPHGAHRNRRQAKAGYNIAEAVKRLSEAARLRRPEIPWKQIAGMRDTLTHNYFGVDLAPF